MNRSLRNACAALLLGGAVLLPQPLRAQNDAGGDFVRDEILARTSWRSVGPAVFGGRVVDIAVHPENPAVYYVATGSGGMFKTTNMGASFAPIFDDQPVVSIGAIALAPSQPDTVWVGSGEANNQRSSYWGDGVYKSTDGGKTFAHAGLRGTDHIGRIAVHPTQPDTVFVAALGALYSANEERGLYRTTDGGKTWKRVHHVSPDVGCVDVAIDPKDPNNVYAASYERRRRAWDFDASGPGSAVWKSTDGGDSWNKLGGGLPSGEIGRIGLAIYPANPQILYACVENANPRQQPANDEERREAEVERARQKQSWDPTDAPGPEPAVQGGRRQRGSRTVGGEVYRTDDGGKTWVKTTDRDVGGSPAYYYGQIRVDPSDDQSVYVLSVPVHSSKDGGKTWRTDFARGLHVDHHALWIDPRNPDHLLLGNDGGLGATWDRGESWDYLNHLPIGQFYAVAVDLQEPYWVYGGTQDNGSWGFPSRGPTQRGISHEDVVKVAGGDGFYVCPDPEDARTVYAESQFGGLLRRDMRTGASTGIKPRARRGGARLRFNWMAPILISPHNSKTIYFASQFLHRSRNRGDDWEAISPDLTTDDRARTAGNVPHCTITTIDESPRREGLLVVGTDDGRVWMTPNGGQRWEELTARFAGVPEKLWVSRVACSPADPDTFYVAFTGYREDDREPYLYATNDGGETFGKIVNDLPGHSINVVREHPRNKDVLFVGTEFGVYCSLDAGTSWHAIGADLPTTPVYDLVVHPREPDLVIGTHGRGIWILDILALEELHAGRLGEALVVCAPRDAHILPRGFGSGHTGSGAREYRVSNGDTGARFAYYLGRDSDAEVTVTVHDATGRELYRRNGGKEAGLHVVDWNPAGGRGRFGGAPRGGQGQRRGQGQRGGRPSPAGPGQYVMRVTRGEETVDKVFRVHGSPGMAEVYGIGGDR